MGPGGQTTLIKYDMCVYIYIYIETDYLSLACQPTSQPTSQPANQPASQPASHVKPLHFKPLRTTPNNILSHFKQLKIIFWEHFKKELEASRDALQAELKAQFADREAALQAEVSHMKEQHELHAKEQQRAASEHLARMEAEMAEKLEAKMKVLDEASRAGPAERAALEQQLAKAQAELQHTAANQPTVVCRYRDLQPGVAGE